ncbi:MAG TPA: KpsF/GutQ family sugar-phosphate isomerase [Bacteroidales bacterium]|nr:KpsF/GutQ family sugar-phosphate isomerase [Bacteroidales bacterium]HNS46135.1 KpsF/GutQ family sugar-phosphate isomerase [Bacteroidales bacterium]
MKSAGEIKQIARQTLRDESEAILHLINYVDDDFYRCIEMIYHSTGRVIITGIGKSAHIANKIVSTLNSTGTRAIFLHAADAIHGDLGMIRDDDIIICISKSGETPEIKVMLPLLKLLGNKLIAMVGNPESYLARTADLVICTAVRKEACPNNLAPTSSTAAQLAMGDALAVCLIECHGFTVKDFARYHPGGSLGKKLYLKVSDLSINNEIPRVDSQANVNQTIIEISSKRLGATAVMEDERLVGIITDGDLRRMLQKNIPLDSIRARDIMTKNPRTIDQNTLVSEALDVMRQNNITQLLVLDEGRYAGVIHLHDILKEGII